MFRKIALGVAIVVLVAAVATLVTVWLVGPDTLAGKICYRILFTAIGLLTMALSIVSLVSAIKSVGQSISNAAKGAAVVGLIIGAIITWGVFFLTWGMSNSMIFSLAFNNMLADAIAATCTLVLMTALACTGVGAIIVAIIGIIDGLIAAICAAAGANELDESHWARQYVCIGISGWITKIFKWIFYSQTYLIKYDDPARLQFTGLNQTVQDWTKGMVENNPLSYDISVTNIITRSDFPIDWKAALFFWQFSDSTAKSSAFNYKVQPTETDLHEGLERGTVTSKWQSIGSHVWSGKFLASTDGFSISMPPAGINRQPEVYFSEGSAIPVQECWAIPLPPFWYPVPFCYIRTERATINSDMGPSLTVDVLPATLDGFYSLSEVGSGSGAFSFSWGRGITLTFPTFRDADGDNLISTAFQGNDPDDSRFDTDNDGLSDYYEVAEGLNPRLFDSDDDGLNDHDEVVAGTDPAQNFGRRWADRPGGITGLAVYLCIRGRWHAARDEGLPGSDAARFGFRRCD